MAALLEVTFQDINQEVSKSSMWVESEEISADVLVALKAASNAKIIKATLSTPVDISDISGNVAATSSVETATSKAIISMRGIDVDSTGEPFAHVRLGVPAPVSPIQFWAEGFALNDDVVALRDAALSKTGVAMTTVESIKYQR